MNPDEIYNPENVPPPEGYRLLTVREHERLLAECVRRPRDGGYDIFHTPKRWGARFYIGSNLWSEAPGIEGNYILRDWTIAVPVDTPSRVPVERLARLRARVADLKARLA